MRILFAIIVYGLKNPRYYIESINLSRKVIVFLSIIIVSFSSFIGLLQVNPVINQLNKDLIYAKEYIPQFQYVNQTLFISDNERPYYYESDTFQLVIDDTIIFQDDNGLKVNEQQKEMINQRIPFGLFLLNNIGYAQINGMVYLIPSYDYLFANPHRLTLFLNYFNDSQWTIYLTIFSIIFILIFIFYWMQMFIIALIAGYFNIRLSVPISLGNRLKLVTVISFVPIVLLELFSLFIPYFQRNFFILASITLTILYYAFKNHTKHVKSVMNSLDPEILEEKLLEVEERIKKNQRKKMNQNKESMKKNKEKDK